MKRPIFIAGIFSLSFLTVVLAKADDWNITKSTHFIVYYKNAPQDFLERLILRAENYYDEIANNLGFRRFNFWLWDNRAKFYIYDNALSYQADTDQPSWSAGCAAARDKIIRTFPDALGFFDSVLPHEMGHIIFREFVGFDNYAVPVWLDEGVASYQENLKRSLAKEIVKQALQEGTFMDWEELSGFNPQSSQDAQSVTIFYAESASIIEFLIKEFGSDNFVLFCQNLRDKKDLDRALRSVYSFGDVKGLQQAWQKYLSEDIRQ